jgi:hypothetical protein
MQEQRNDKDGLDESLDRKREIWYDDMVVTEYLGWMEGGLDALAAAAAAPVIDVEKDWANFQATERKVNTVFK